MNHFQHILSICFRRSQSSIDTLEIDVDRIFGRSHSRSAVPTLLCVTDVVSALQLPCLPITRLIWSNDKMRDTDVRMKCIAGSMHTFFPKLEHFSFGIHQVATYYAAPDTRFARPSESLRCINAALKFNLRSLDLHCPSWPVVQHLGSIVHLQSLESLSICSLVPPRLQSCDASALASLHLNGPKNVSVERCKVEFVFDIQRPEQETAHGSIQPELVHLFSCFVGLKHVELGFASRTFTRLFAANVNWNLAFGVLFEQKTRHLIQFGAVPQLNSVDFTRVPHTDAIDIVKALRLNVDESNCNLLHFGMSVISNQQEMSARKWFLFQQRIINPFLKLHMHLKSVRLAYGCAARPYYGQYCYRCLDERSSVSVDDVTYMDPLLSLVGSLPRSLVSLELTMPRFVGFSRHPELKQMASIKLVRKLCSLLSEKDGCDLDSIVLNKFRLTAEARDYLTFVFGYHNKIDLTDNNIRLCFS